jgi:integrase
MNAEIEMKYRRRVPKQLVGLLGRREITRTFQSEDDALELDLRINKAVKIMESELAAEMKQQLICDELEDYVKSSSQTKHMVAMKYDEASRLYLEQSNVSEEEMLNRRYFFEDLLPSMLKYLVGTDNPTLSDIQPFHINKMCLLVAKMPNRNTKGLKELETYNIIKAVDTGQSFGSVIHADTVNKQVKRIKAFANFGASSGLFSIPSNIVTKKTVVAPKDQRKALSLYEVKSLLQQAPSKDMYNFITLLYLTGLRASEIDKGDIVEIDGVRCFDLRNADKLKTLSSHRIVPLHPEIRVTDFDVTIKYLLKRTKKLMDEVLNDSNKKSAYSLRHSFATHLIEANVRPEVVSELLGHTHSTMTLSRYSKGFSIQTLSDAVQTLGF